jgi:hypothetical protein
MHHISDRKMDSKEDQHRHKSKDDEWHASEEATKMV